MDQPVTYIAQAHVAIIMYVEIKQSLAYLQDLIPILASVIVIYLISAKVGIKFCRCAREYFICTYIWLHVLLELTVTGWCIITSYT